MNASWWLVIAAVALLGLVAALVDGWGRGHRPPGARVRPRPAEIWWATVPYEERGGGKDRPCLVLSVRGRRAVVAKITTRYREGRGGVIALPPGSVGDARGRASFLDTGELRKVRVGDFRRRVGVVDPALWDQVRHLSS
ncbi:type II toxin-antitoxin system PemK/MazF family toxin [Streptomyces sp. ISL-12]|uniref:type II toxin-antitoxin system PemK/MazF family toxin n=1 Tax=Streptomyces sp. ISL-12 TaxID=2819177 RepID=UPI001BE87A15|nr:type II toxin-antitoxin system PemK/MazF family toxin [Streptomyces sp. ISL-12]MBT2410740.1 type II toxin-antitoxin system PemK/MazF family toxin [Streptomyces sp. ISL-12]